MWTGFSDPFGTTAANSNPAGAGTFIYNVRFPGQIYDSQAGLQQNWNRDYDPMTGRYAESDPIGLYGGINTYGYVGANPVAFADPLGLAQCVYAIAQHSLSCVSNDGQTAIIAQQGLHSGLCPCNDNPSCAFAKNIGPTPPDSYNISANRLPGRSGWWALQSQSWRPRVDGILCDLGLKRCGFDLHLGNYSEGCLTFDIKAPAAVASYNAISSLFRSDSPSNTITVIQSLPPHY
jgi:RHS repeat-associated protein